MANASVTDRLNTGHSSVLLLAGVLIGSILSASLAGVGSGRAQAASRHSVAPHVTILVDAQAHCGRPGAVDQSNYCRKTKVGNGVTGLFHIPGTHHTRSVPWGITWSYRCARRGSFYTAVYLPSFDGVIPQTSLVTEGHQGRGYKMEPPALWKPALDAVPPQWQTEQILVVDSSCAWHVRAVVDSPSILLKNEPPLP